MKQKSILKKVKKLREYYKKGKIPILSEHEVHPELEKKARERYLYFTLPPCINFQRSSPAMWQSALKTWNDSQTNYLFFPEVVVKTSSKKIQKDLLKHKLSLQKNKHTLIWTTISRTLHNHFDDDPRNVLQEGECNAEKVLKIIQKEKRELFPYLRGAKMANYWLYIITKYTDAKLKNMDAISIIPDTHVIQSSVELNLVPKNAKPEEVAEAWRSLLKGTNINLIDMHPILWNWSRNNFQPSINGSND